MAKQSRFLERRSITIGGELIMARWRAVRLIFVTVFVMLAMGGAAQAASSITITRPTGTDVVAESNDFASDIFGDPWDMSQPTDFGLNGLSYDGIANASFSGGMFSGTQANGDPYVTLLHPGVYSAIPTGRDGQKYPVNTGAYDSFSFRMSATGSDDCNLYWFYNNVWTSFGVTSSTRVSGIQKVYKANLTTQPYAWSGFPIGLRFDLGSVRGQLGSFSLDWVKLYKANTRPFSVNWNELSPGYVTIYLDADSDNNNGNEIWMNATTDQAGANTLSIDLSPYMAGTYYIYMVDRNGQRTVPVPLTISAPPLINITDPSERGGEDFATTFGGDPWDMNSESDIAFATGMAASFNQNGLQIGVNAGNDPAWYFRQPAWIDTARYHRLTFRYAYDGAFDVGGGTVARVFWSHNGWDPANFVTSDDIVVYPGWFEYTIDLRTVPTENGAGWNGGVNLMRLDPLELPESRAYYLDYVRLTADNEARGPFTVRWTESKPAPRPTTVDIYVDTDDFSQNGNEILVAQNVPSVAGENAYTANFGSVPTGTYRVLFVAHDDVSTVRKYSNGPLVVYGPTIHHFDVTTPANQTAGTPFSVTVTAKDSYNNPIAYTGRAILSDTSGTISPAQTGNFVNGVWTGNVTVTKSGSDIITASLASPAASGSSGSFNVAPGPFASVRVNAGPAVKRSKTMPVGADSLDAYGNVLPGQTFTWSALGGGILPGPSPTAILTAGPSLGSCTVTATTGGRSGSALINIVGDYTLDMFYNYGSATSGIWRMYTNGATLMTPFNIWSSGAGNWDAGRSQPIIGDINGDNESDMLVFYDYGNATSGVWSMQGNGYAFAAPQLVWSSGAGSWEAARSRAMTGDYNNDGHDDIIIFYDYGNATSAIWGMAGNGATFATPKLIWSSGAGNWESARSKPMIGDYNNDSIDDIVIFYDYGRATSAIWGMAGNGTTFATPALIWSSGTGNWESARSRPMIADYNNDNKDDIAIFYDYGNANSAIWGMAGTGSTFSTPVLIWSSGPGNWEAGRSTPVVGDYNDDRRDDIVIFYDYGGGTSGVWGMLGSGGSFAGPQPIWASNSGSWEAPRSKVVTK